MVLKSFSEPLDVNHRRGMSPSVVENGVDLQSGQGIIKLSYLSVLI
jgi:hypothetical protein